MLEQVCYSCKETGHIVANCPKVNIVYNKSVLSDILEREKKFRKDFKRKPRKFHTGDKYYEMRMAASFFQKLINFAKHKYANFTEEKAFILKALKQRKKTGNSVNDEEFNFDLDEVIIQDEFIPKDQEKSPALVNESFVSVTRILTQIDEQESPNTTLRLDNSMITSHEVDHTSIKSNLKIIQNITTSQNRSTERKKKKKFVYKEIIFDSVAIFKYYFPHNNITSRFGFRRAGTM